MMTTTQLCLRPMLTFHLNRIRQAGPLAYRNAAGPLQRDLEHLAAIVDHPTDDDCWFHAQAVEAAQAGRPLVAAYLAGRILTGEGWQAAAFPTDTGHGQVVTIAPDVGESLVHILNAAEAGARGLEPRMLVSLQSGLVEARETGSVEWWHHQVVLLLSAAEEYLDGAWRALWTVLPQLIDCGEVHNYAK